MSVDHAIFYLRRVHRDRGTHLKLHCQIQRRFPATKRSVFHKRPIHKLCSGPDVQQHMAKKKKKSEEKTGSTSSIEEAMSELHEIVQALESGQDPLDASLSKFERGMTLLRTCHDQLEAAAARIEILTGIESNGDVRTDSFDGSATAANADSSTNEGGNDSTLF